MVKYVDRGILLRNDVIAEKLADIKGSVNLIKENIPENIEEFVWLDLVKDGIYRRLGFAIERLMNVYAIINFDLKLGAPSSDIEIIYNLIENDVIGIEAAEKIKELRNLNMYINKSYYVLRDDLAFERIKIVLGYFDVLISEIKAFLERHKETKNFKL